MTTYAVDFESHYSDTCSIGLSGTWNYLRHPDCDIYMVAIVGDDGTEWVGRPEEFDWSSIARHDTTWVAHNYSFDAAVYTRLIELGKVPDIWPGHWFCSADAAAYHGLPRNLKGAIEAKFKGILEVSKDTRNAMKGQHWDSMTPEFQKEVSDYALHDSRCCLALWKALEATFPWHERMISQHTAWMGWEGLPVNRDKIEDGIQTLKDQMWEAEQNIPWAGTEKLLSPKALADECRKVGINPPRSLAQDSEECEAWLEEHGGTYPWIGAMRTWRRCNALLKKLEAMLARVRPDGVMGFGMKFFGAHCVTGDHEVLTKDGWVRIDQWAGGEIAQWREGLSGHEIDFLPATANSFARSQDLLELDAPYAKGVFTTGHTIAKLTHGTHLLKPTRAEDMPSCSTAWLANTGNAVWSGEITADQIRVLVAVQADGHYTDGGRGYLQFCLRKTRKIERIKGLLDACGIPWRVQEFPSTPGQFRVSVRKADLPKWLTPARKVFGPWLLDTTAEARKAFADEVSRWDGWRDSLREEYYSSIFENIEWVSTMAHLAGRCAAGTHTKVRGFSVGVRKKTRTMCRSEHWSQSTRCDDTVYCPTTETGFWLYRYKGCIGVTGNTGRDSGDAGLNVQNFSRGELFGVNMREMIEAPAGKTFVIVDLAQIEPRCLFSLAGDTRMLDAIRAHYGIYEAFAVGANMWSGPAGTLKKTDPTLYQMAKAACLGCGFGMSGNKFHVTAPALTGGAYAPTLAEAEAVVQRYRQSYKSVTGLWDKLDKAMRRHVGKDFVVELPSGRCLKYGRVLNYGGLSAEIMRMGKLTRCKFWHGTLTENLVQATARDVFMDCTLRTLRAGYDVVLRVHDEIVCLVDEDKAEAALAGITKIFSTPPDWMPHLPIACEGVVSKVYTK